MVVHHRTQDLLEASSMLLQEGDRRQRVTQYSQIPSVRLQGQLLHSKTVSFHSTHPQTRQGTPPLHGPRLQTLANRRTQKPNSCTPQVLAGTVYTTTKGGSSLQTRMKTVMRMKTTMTMKMAMTTDKTRRSTSLPAT